MFNSFISYHHINYTCHSVVSYIFSIWHHHHHHVVPPARISPTLSRHSSRSFIASGRSSGLHPVSSHSCCMYDRADRLTFAWPYAGVYMSSSFGVACCCYNKIFYFSLSWLYSGFLVRDFVNWSLEISIQLFFFPFLFPSCCSSGDLCFLCFFLVAVICLSFLFFMLSSYRCIDVATLSPILASRLPPSFLDTYYYYCYYYYYYFPWAFFTTALADGFSLESERQ